MEKLRDNVNINELEKPREEANVISPYINLIRQIDLRDNLEKENIWNDGFIGQDIDFNKILKFRGPRQPRREFFAPGRQLDRPLVPHDQIVHPVDVEVLPLEQPFEAPVKQTKIEFFQGTPEGFLGFVSKEPQKDQLGRIRYLLTSGLAVELITGVQRFHHDIDLVLFDYRNEWWKKYLTDNRTARRYWADMNFDPAFMEETAWDAVILSEGVEHKVSTVHPAIIMMQKLSYAWGRPPRKIDIVDAIELYRYWEKKCGYNPEWKDIMKASVDALPLNERRRTLEILTIIEGAKRKVEYERGFTQEQKETPQPATEQKGRFKQILARFAVR